MLAKNEKAGEIMITMTEQAALKVKEMLTEIDQAEPTKYQGFARDPDKSLQEPRQQFLRFGVQSGGCSGFSYSLGFDTEKQESDLVFEQHGIKMLIEKESQLLLQGTIIDYKESMMGGGFSITNPNATATCGCGSSFRTATKEGNPNKC